MRLPILAGCALLGALAPALARADEVADGIEAGRKAYATGDLNEAADELGFALQALRARIGAAYAQTFPAPAAGWTRDDGGGDANGAQTIPIMGGTTLQRTYSESAGEGRIEAGLLTGGSLLQGFAALMSNPQFMGVQPNAKRVKIGRENAVVIYDGGDKSGQLVMDIGGKVTLSLQGSGLASEAPLVDLAGRWDMAKLRALAGL